MKALRQDIMLSNGAGTVCDRKDIGSVVDDIDDMVRFFYYKTDCKPLKILCEKYIEAYDKEFNKTEQQSGG